MLDQLSDGLEKSTVGTIVMLGAFGLIVYLTVVEGGTDTVDDLITTAMIVAATLMGVNSVADIFKVSKEQKITLTKESKDLKEVQITETNEEPSGECSTPSRNR